jgi:hypothetical protein
MGYLVNLVQTKYVDILDFWAELSHVAGATQGKPIL